MEIVEVKCFSVLYLNHKTIPYIGWHCLPSVNTIVKSNTIWFITDTILSYVC